jgi:hypothetical protein
MCIKLTKISMFVLIYSYVGELRLYCFIPMLVNYVCIVLFLFWWTMFVLFYSYVGELRLYCFIPMLVNYVCIVLFLCWWTTFVLFYSYIDEYNSENTT